MTFLYHGVPEDMQGTVLMPLTLMLEKDPELYAKYLQKYEGREEVVERRIPLLNCPWNDVVQLLPFHPRKLFELQKQLGVIKSIPDYRYFAIDSSQLDSSRTVVFFKTSPGEENVTMKWLSEVNLLELQDIPPATVHYYESMVGKAQPVFNYQFVPHIVYRGTIDISSSPVIDIVS